MIRTLRIVAAGVALAAVSAASAGGPGPESRARALESLAQTRSQDDVAEAIAMLHAQLAGGPDNAEALVLALRNGATVRLAVPNSHAGAPELMDTMVFETPLGAMGWAEVAIALGVTGEVLARAGVMEPERAQLQAALLGGVIELGERSVVTPGVLRLRADGLEWPEIARMAGARAGTVRAALDAMGREVRKLRPLPRPAMLVVRSVRSPGPGYLVHGHGRPQERAEGD